MSHLINPDAPLDDADEAALDAQAPPSWQPEPEPEPFDLAAYAVYDEKLPF